MNRKNNMGSSRQTLGSHSFVINKAGMAPTVVVERVKSCRVSLISRNDLNSMSLKMKKNQNYLSEVLKK